MKTTRLSPFARSLLLAAAAVGAVGCTQPPIQVRPVSSMPTDASAGYDPNYQAAVTAINERDYARALDYLQAARDKDPKNVRVLNAFGVVYDKLGRFDLSARYYAQASTIEPDSHIVAANLAYSRKLQGLVSPGSDTMVATSEPEKLRAPAPSTPSPLRLTDLPSASVMPVAGVLPVTPREVAAAEPEAVRTPLPSPLGLTELPAHSLMHVAPLAPMTAVDVAMADVETPRANVPPPLRLTDQPSILHTAALTPFRPQDVVAAPDEARMSAPPPRRLTDLAAGSLLHVAALVPFTPDDVLAASAADDTRAPVPPPRLVTGAGSPVRTAALMPITPNHVDDVADPEVPRPNVPAPKAVADRAPAAMVRTASLAPITPSHVDDVVDPEVPRPNVPAPKTVADRAPADSVRMAALAPIAPSHVDDIADPEVPRPNVPLPETVTGHAQPAMMRVATLTPVTPTPVDYVAEAQKSIAAPIAVEKRAATPVAHAFASLSPRLPAVPPLSESALARMTAAANAKISLLQTAALRLPAVPRLAPAVPDTVAQLSPVAHYRVEVVNASGRRDGAEPVRRGLAAMGWSVPLTQIAERSAESSTTLIYPASVKATVTAWARTLPFHVRLAAGSGDAQGMRLVVGTDFLTWHRKNHRATDVWRKPLTVLARADIPVSTAQ